MNFCMFIFVVSFASAANDREMLGMFVVVVAAVVENIQLAWTHMQRGGRPVNRNRRQIP